MKSAGIFSGKGIIRAAVLLSSIAALCAITLVQKTRAQQPHSIISISVCSGPGANASADCPNNATNTQLPVLAPGGGSINNYGGLDTLADEHSTVFPPGALPFTRGYTFFAAARTTLSTDSSGAVAFTSSGPDSNGQWTLDFAPGYGLYAPFNPPGSRNAQLFLSPVQHRVCPSVSDATQQDPTFDLNYANPGSVVIDPTNPFDRGAGNLFMIYEGSNRCIGLTGGDNVAQNNSFYSAIAVATSFDFGHSWPAYRYDLNRYGFPNSPLPNQNPSFGPRKAFGATGRDVCIGNDCWLTQFFPLPTYGRYTVLHTQVTVADAINTLGPNGGLLTVPIGDTVPAAFVDDVGYRFGNPRPVYLYEIGNYAVGDSIFGNPPLPGAPRNSDLVISRAQLNGGTAQLAFKKWFEGSFSTQDGNGGVSSPIFPAGDFANCEATGQLKTMGSISYVAATQQYLLTFVCISAKGNPANPAADSNNGAAWFWSTNADLSHPENWSTPQQIIGTWKQFDPNVSCNDFPGWYPTFMSLGEKSANLDTTGYVFYMKGCTSFGTGVPGGRQYSTRQFTITTN
jgi:hypothetical protein